MQLKKNKLRMAVKKAKEEAKNKLYIQRFFFIFFFAIPKAKYKFLSRTRNKNEKKEKFAFF